jgi:hypothetical protein
MVARCKGHQSELDVAFALCLGLHWMLLAIRLVIERHIAVGQQQYITRDTESPCEIRPKCTNGFRPYPTKMHEGFCWARTTSLRLHGGDVQAKVPREATVDEYGQTGLKWPE